MTNTIVASKFFSAAIAAPELETVVFVEDDFDSLSEFKSALADQIRTVSEQGIALMWQHKGFQVRGEWSISIKQLNKYCLSHNAQLVSFGRADNDYTWKVVPLRSAPISPNTNPF